MAPTKAALLADDLVERFADDIHSGRLLPGARFPTEKSITEMFQVSRTVVREAFARMAAQGLLESRRGSGAFVAANAAYRAFQVVPEDLVAIDDVLKLLEMRMGLETEMAALAAERRTNDDLGALHRLLGAMEASDEIDELVRVDRAFHATLAAATRNDYYVRFTEFLGLRLVPPRRLYIIGEGVLTPRQYAMRINADHKAIVQAIADADPDAARVAARSHMQSSIDRYDRIRGDTDDNSG